MNPNPPVISRAAEMRLPWFLPRIGGGTGPSAATVAGLAAPRWGFLLSWAAGWAAVGFVVAAAISLAVEGVAFQPLLLESVLFAEVVGFTALVSARVVFPLFTRLPLVVRLAMQVLTLFSGTVFGSVSIVLAQPLFTLARPATVLTIVLVNAMLAVVVGITLHTYDSMRRQIEEQYRMLREKEALERELAIARDVQRELLPSAIPEVRGLQLAAVCTPAVGVGGDLYDFLPVSEDLFGLVIADVSGKGIPAALVMAGIQASVRSLALPGLPPGELNRRLNEMLVRSTSDARYATMFFALYDHRERLLTYSNAGHHPPLLLSEQGLSRLAADGLPIGILGGTRYGEGARRLKAGDLLALYTDGVVEAPDPQGNEFGEARLIGVLERHRDENLDDLLQRVVDDVERWRGSAPPHDDITLVLARAT
jgi:serine phosphatase RsbU (regulator of sigma subunit)